MPRNPDGKSPVNPISVSFDSVDKSLLILVLGTPFIAGQTVTWNYDSSGTCNLQEISTPNTKADSQVYNVNNKLNTSAFSKAFSKAFH